ncbi:hypothetical protein MTP10_12095 [Nonomuraea sp. 3-1Str]|uniref:hypothetical protein n=1 Tax=Nonomuraea sp. 3-1Str TaxID=2929801 RepID=UPI0028651634|nr:hypothetical protein [Nonomuraea sp. 3-1Str]MDR8409481.1 hypothetical protein [Nonomuraea sp. 3-1Str]
MRKPTIIAGLAAAAVLVTGGGAAFASPLHHSPTPASTGQTPSGKVATPEPSAEHGEQDEKNEKTENAQDEKNEKAEDGQDEKNEKSEDGQSKKNEKNESEDGQDD